MAQADALADAIGSSVERVKRAAAQFGSSQEEAASAWAEWALSGESPSANALLEQEVALFTECLLDADEAKCQELDAALQEMEALLDERGKGAIADFMTSVKQRVASSRVRNAASRFGPEQATAAAAWVEQAAATGEHDTSDLLEKKVALFEECTVTDAVDSGKCNELEEALEEMTGLLAENAAAEAAAAAAAPAGFEWGGTY